MMVSLSSQWANGKAPASNNKPVAGLKPLKAKLDPSVLPIPTLTAGATINVLPAKTVPTLIGKQQAQVVPMDLVRTESGKTVPLLRAAVVEDQPLSFITTIEHSVTPQFHFGLLALMPKLAPDLARQMEAQLAQSKFKLAAQVAKQEKLMKQQLNATRAPVPMIPGAVQKAQPDPLKPLKLPLADRKRQPRAPVSDVVHRPDPQLTKQLDLQLAQAKKPVRLPKSPLVAYAVPASHFAEQIESQLAQSQKQTRPQIEIANQQLQAQLLHAHQLIGKMPDPKPSASPSTTALLQGPGTHLKLSFPKPAEDVAAQMHAQLVAAKLKLPPQTDVDAQLLQAKKHNEEVSAKLKPQMDALVTDLRVAPDRVNTRTTASGATVSTTAEIAGSNVILWDKWHLHFAELAHLPLLSAVQKCSNPTGANTVSITVSSNHHVDVSVARTKNQAFDQAVLQAYRSLDGNPDLQFPPGSKRTSINFMIDVSHSAATSPAEVRSRTSKGDKETLRPVR